MKPYYVCPDGALYHGDVLDVLRELEAESVHCVVTSPPYWNLRNYQCDGQIGLEPTLEGFIAKMVEVFAEVRRVLRTDGTLWLNIGDSYAANRSYQVTDNKHVDVGNSHGMSIPNGLKSKDLCMVPARLALALQADGWWIRSEVTWCKTSPMPESVTDRPTSATEKVYLLTKNERYFYDAEAVKVPSVSDHPSGNGFKRDCRLSYDGRGQDEQWQVTPTRNLWNYWILGPEPYAHAHFATFPTALVEPCIKASTSERGCCPKCGKPWRRIVEKLDPSGRLGKGYHDHKDDLARGQRGVFPAEGAPQTITTGWQSSCSCGISETVPGTVLDPFMGSGTVAQVARTLGRRWAGIELNPAYLELARKRIERVTLPFESLAVLPVRTQG